MRVLKLLLLVLLFAGVASVKLACNAGVHVHAAAALGGASAHVDVDADAGGYAAMDEIPVAGGELRLVAPKVTRFEGETREMIGFPLQHTNISAKLSGSVGVYEVEQEFANPFAEPIEAVYAFPLGAHGAVTGYELAIGERTIRGAIHTTDDAQAIYDDAIARGHTAAIVRQVQPNLFTQRVGNIPPGQRVTIRLTFVQLVDYRDDHYELVVPTTIGPRYKPAIDVAYVPAHQAGIATVTFSAELDPGTPVTSVTSPTHTLVTHAVSPTRTQVALAAGAIPDRDLIIDFTTAGPETRVGLVTHKTADTGYFVLSVQPKATYRAADIASREVLLVIDHSGSMDGEPLAQAKTVASGILDTLTERDTFDVIGFASGVESLAPSPIRGDAAGKQQGIDYLAAMHADGGTEMGAGIAAMLANAPDGDRVRVIYFLTDGDVGDDDALVGAARDRLGANRIFTIGVGSAPNRSLLDRLAHTGRGYASYLAPRESGEALAQTLVAHSARPYLTDVTIDWGGLAIDGLTPDIIPDVYAGQPIIVSGRYRAAGRGTIVVHARTAGRAIAIPVEVTLPEDRDFAPVEALWARRQIEQHDGDPHAIEALGLAFHLVTAYTAFVAVDRDGKAVDHPPRVVEQPSVTPKDYGGGDRYIGFGGWGSGGPESSLPWGWLILATALVPLWLVGRRFA